MKFKLILLVIFCMIVFNSCSLENTDCGFPGIPQNGKMNISYSGNVYHFNYSSISLNESIRNLSCHVETRVEYECEMFQKFQLNGSKERICQENGTWTGQLPFCDENVAFEKELLIYDVKERVIEPTSLLTDGKTVGKASGIYLDGVNNKKLILPFNSPLNIRSVIIHGDDKEKWEENIFKPTLRKNNEEQDTCEISRNSKKSIEWSCPDDRILTEYLQFFHYSRGKYLITEMQVFVRSNNKCGYPDIPDFGNAILIPDNFNPKSANYSCSLGHELIGSTERNCTEGIWTGQQPICSKIVTTTWTTTEIMSLPDTQSSTEQRQKQRGSELITDSIIATQLKSKDDTETSYRVMKTEPGGPTTKHLMAIIIILSTIVAFLALTLSIVCLYKRRKRKNNTNDGYETPNSTDLLLFQFNFNRQCDQNVEGHIYEETDDV